MSVTSETAQGGETNGIRRYDLGNAMAVELDNPAVVALSAPGEKRWGYYQFPALSRLPDGRILCQFSAQPDAVAAYGNPPKVCVSSDQGATWKPLQDQAFGVAAPHCFVSEVFDGEFLTVPPAAPLNLEKAGLALPKPAGSSFSYVGNNLYRFADCAPGLRQHFEALPAYRWTPATRAWKRDDVAYDMRDALLWTRAEGPESRLVARTWFERRLLRVDRELFYADYRQRYLAPDGSVPEGCGVACMVSTDNGRSFQRRGTIALDPAGKDMMTEPALARSVKGDLVCVIRRADQKQKPMAITYSKDRGKTWEPAATLHKFGVFPSLVTLEAGVMALAFGRPGVHLSFSLNGEGRAWTAPLPVESRITTDTCGYTSILALSAREFLLAYSDFKHPGAGGKPRKAILVRKVRVVETGAGN